MKFYYDPVFLKHDFPGHPESPERLKSILKVVGKTVKPKQYGDDKLLLVHSEEHVERVRQALFIDYDTPVSKGTFDIASRSADAAIHAAVNNGFALTRPPGHHAGKNFAGGFCYFNNVAIAVRRMGVKAVIIDVDVHHGNGTQDIFFGDRKVVYVSLHQSPFYPGTGLASSLNCFNHPLPAGTGGEGYLMVLKRALGAVKLEPELVALSVGFDTYEKDPIASFNLSVQDYEKMGRIISHAFNCPKFAVLEGGYCAEDLGKLVKSIVTGLES